MVTMITKGPKGQQGPPGVIGPRGPAVSIYHNLVTIVTSAL